MFRPSLACDASMEDFERILSHTPLYASPKLDGIRATVLNGQLVSRTLKPIRNRYIQGLLGHPHFEGIDGELIVGEPRGEGVFARTSSGVMSEAGSPDFTYYVFDDHSYRDTQDEYHRRLTVLYRRLERLAASSYGVPIQLLQQDLLRDIKSLEELEDHYVSAGYEGVILRHPLAPYKQGRSTLREGYMLKLKRFSDSEAWILGFEELRHNENEATTDARGYTARSSSKANKRPGGTLGKLLVRDIHRPEWEFSVGGGFDFALRDQIWQNQSEYLNQIIKYKYLPVGTIDRPRHPIFLGFRDASDIVRELPTVQG